MPEAGYLPHAPRIVSGDSLDVLVRWGEAGLLSGVPTGVSYGVFDYDTGTQIGSTQTVGGLAAEMHFIIDGALLVNSNPRPRRLRLEITGEFADDRKTLVDDVFVERRLTP